MKGWSDGGVGGVEVKRGERDGNKGEGWMKEERWDEDGRGG